MSLRNLQTGFELDDDMLGTAAGGAFSDIRTNVQIIVDELNASGVRCFGAEQAACEMLTGEKWKQFAQRHGIACAYVRTWPNPHAAMRAVRNAEAPFLLWLGEEEPVCCGDGEQARHCLSAFEQRGPQKQVGFASCGSAERKAFVASGAVVPFPGYECSEPERKAAEEIVLALREEGKSFTGVLTVDFCTDGAKCTVIRCFAGMDEESAPDALNRATDRETAAAFLSLYDEEMRA